MYTVHTCTAAGEREKVELLMSCCLPTLQLEFFRILITRGAIESDRSRLLRVTLRSTA